MRRRVLLIALWFFVGAVVNVGVAWGLAASIVWRKTYPRTQVEAPVAWPIAKYSAWPKPHTSEQARSCGVSLQAIDAGDLYWPSRPRLGVPTSFGGRGMLVYETGLPLRSMCMVRVSDFQQFVVSEKWYAGLIALAPTNPGRDAVVLPLRPLWPGFALNTCFYAFLAWSLIRAPRTLRRWRRRRAGRCIACGYDLKGLAEDAPCPECGRASAASSSPQRGARA